MFPNLSCLAGTSRDLEGELAFASKDHMKKEFSCLFNEYEYYVPTIEVGILKINQDQEQKTITILNETHLNDLFTDAKKMYAPNALQIAIEIVSCTATILYCVGSLISSIVPVTAAVILLISTACLVSAVVMGAINYVKKRELNKVITKRINYLGIQHVVRAQALIIEMMKDFDEVRYRRSVNIRRPLYFYRVILAFSKEGTIAKATEMASSYFNEELAKGRLEEYAVHTEIMAARAELKKIWRL